jgi:hypothetical protein
VKAGEKAARDKLVVRDRAKGWSWAKVARKHDIDVRTAERVWNDDKALHIPELSEGDAMDVVYESLKRLEEWQNQLADVTETSSGAIKVGAIRAQIDCENKKIELRQATGMLPKNLGKLAVEWDVRFVVKQVVAVLEAHDVPMETQQALLEAIKPDAS